MGKYVKLAVLLVFGIFTTGCATTGGYEAEQATQKKAPCTPKKAITYPIAGGALGGIFEKLGTKGAIAAGAFGGLWYGMMQDETDCEHKETVRQVQERGGGKSAVSLRSLANEQEAFDLYKDCQDIVAGKSSVAARRTVPDCKKILARASEVRTEVEVEKLVDRVYNVEGVSYNYSGGSYGSYGGCNTRYLESRGYRTNGRDPYRLRRACEMERARDHDSALYYGHPSRR